MLSEEMIQLLTAYVDGELGQRQRKAVVKLLHRSSEARDLLRQLQENAHRLRQLPLRRVQPSLVDEIVAAIANYEPTPKAAPARRLVRRRWAALATAALAASVLLAVAGSVYLMTLPEKREPDYTGGPVASQTRPPEKAHSPEATSHRTTNPLIARVTQGVYSQYAAPLPPERDGPVMLLFRDLSGPASGQLAGALQRDPAVQLDVTVKNNALALERIEGVLHDTGIKVVIDPAARAALKKDPTAKVEYWVYAENVQPTELQRVLQELGRDDSRLQKFARSPFEKLAVAPLNAAEKKDLSGKLGVDPGQIKPPPSPEPGAVEKPFQRWTRSAVVLPPQAGRTSDEVRAFVNGRARQQPGTLQVLVRIHPDK